MEKRQSLRKTITSLYRKASRQLRDKEQYLIWSIQKGGDRERGYEGTGRKNHFCSWILIKSSGKLELTCFPQSCLPTLHPGCARNAPKSRVWMPQQLQDFILRKIIHLNPFPIPQAFTPILCYLMINVGRNLSCCPRSTLPYPSWNRGAPGW